LGNLKHTIGKLWPTCTVTVFGSYATDLYLPDGDLDIIVRNCTSPVTKALHRISARIQQSATNVLVIAHAKVPILKFQDAESQIWVDISVNTGNGEGNTRMVNYFLRRYPVLRPLVIVLKVYLAQRELKDPSRGGLGSYTLILMIIFFLKQRAPKTGDLGLLLVSFLSFFGNEFDFKQNVMCLLVNKFLQSRDCTS